MAIVQYSALVNQVRGKLNGSVLSRNRSVDVVYRKGQPARNLSVRQSRRRSIFSFVQRSWKAQPESVRQDYAILAQNNPTTDRFGNPKVLSAYAMWLHVNIFYYSIYRVLLTDINTASALPLEPDFWDIDTYQYVTLSGNIIVLRLTIGKQFSVPLGLARYSLLISPPFSGGYSRFYGTYYRDSRQFGILNGLSTVDIPVSEIGGEASEGERVAIRFRLYREQQGIVVNTIDSIIQF